jgi:hypothetical protein
VVSDAPATLYLLGKDPEYPLDRRLGGPQRLEEKYFASAKDQTLLIHYTN